MSISEQTQDLASRQPTKSTLLTPEINKIPCHDLKCITNNFESIRIGQILMIDKQTTFVAGYLPAKKASSIDPVSIIRG